MTTHATLSLAVADLERFVGRKIDDLIDELAALMLELSEEGKERMREILHAEDTETGHARVARGGNGPGRFDTGRMHDAISNKSTAGAKAIEAEWGWLDEVLDYFLYQEYGNESFNVLLNGMGALRGSYAEMREKLIDRLNDLGLKVG